MKRILSILFVCLLVSISTYAQLEYYPIIVDVKKKSMLSIEGKSNIVDFMFSQTSEEFIDETLHITASKKNDILYLSKSTLEIPVKSFTSSNKMALKDFYKLVKSEEYPNMHITLDHIELKDNSSTAVGNAIIDVTITDVTKRYKFPVTADKNGNNFTFDVKKDINIRDFNLTPPVHMLGMIKVDEWITINLFMECDILLPVESAELTP